MTGYGYLWNVALEEFAIFPAGNPSARQMYFGPDLNYWTLQFYSDRQKIFTLSSLTFLRQRS